jgi:hypothetical protein
MANDNVAAAVTTSIHARCQEAPLTRDRFHGVHLSVVISSKARP